MVSALVKILFLVSLATTTTTLFDGIDAFSCFHPKGELGRLSSFVVGGSTQHVRPSTYVEAVGNGVTVEEPSWTPLTIIVRDKDGAVRNLREYVNIKLVGGVAIPPSKNSDEGETLFVCRLAGSAIVTVEVSAEKAMDGFSIAFILGQGTLRQILTTRPLDFDHIEAPPGNGLLWVGANTPRVKAGSALCNFIIT